MWTSRTFDALDALWGVRRVARDSPVQGGDETAHAHNVARHPFQGVSGAHNVTVWIVMRSTHAHNAL